MGCTQAKYCLISLLAANREGRKSISEVVCPPVPPKKNPDEGIIYAGPGFNHSDAGGMDTTGCDGGKALPSPCSLFPGMKESDMVNSSYKGYQR